MSIYFVIAGIAVCLCFSALFSATEMAYSSINRIRMENLADDGNRGAIRALKIAEKYDDALSTILIGNNLANIASSSLGSVLVLLIAGAGANDRYNWISTVGITVLVIIFGECIPKITAKKNANTVAVRWSGVISTLMLILWPVVRLVVLLIHLITMGMKDETEDPDEAVEELQSIIETAEDEAVLDEDRSELIQAAIDFSEISAFEVMTARVDVCAVDVDDDTDEILSVIEEAPFSRIPVYEDSIDNVIGMLYINHFLKKLTDDAQVDIRSLLMPPCYIYKTMKLPAVLSQLRKAKQHLAIVTDEYGGTLGVVSMEDVLEQIVGEIWDESDVVEQEIVMRAEDEYELDGDMTLYDFLELVGINENGFEAESDTLGGWTMEYLGRYPSQGEGFEFNGMQITVLETDGLRVEKLLVKKLPQPDENEE